MMSNSGEAYAIGMGSRWVAVAAILYISPDIGGTPILQHLPILSRGTEEVSFPPRSNDELMGHKNQVEVFSAYLPSCGSVPHTGEVCSIRISCPTNGMKYRHTPMTCFTPSPVFKPVDGVRWCFCS